MNRLESEKDFGRQRKNRLEHRNQGQNGFHTLGRL